MKITPEVRDFAAKQNAGAETFLAAEVAEKGMTEMTEMSRRYRVVGNQLYVRKVLDCLTSRRQRRQWPRLGAKYEMQ
jgi:hypothetical protein